ncbi:Hypothetical predicted protein, partial [Mytilus galloprovincialis]
IWERLIIRNDFKFLIKHVRCNRIPIFVNKNDFFLTVGLNAMKQFRMLDLSLIWKTEKEEEEKEVKKFPDQGVSDTASRLATYTASSICCPPRQMKMRLMIIGLATYTASSICCPPRQMKMRLMIIGLATYTASSICCPPRQMKMRLMIIGLATYTASSICCPPRQMKNDHQYRTGHICNL